MIKTVYAENFEYDPGLPFRFHRDIKKTPVIGSGIADWHEAIELQFCLEGSGNVFMNNESVDISEGDTAIINSNVIHHTGSDKNIVYDCLIIDSDFCGLIGMDTSQLFFERKTSNRELWEISRKFRRIFEDNDDICRQAKLYECVTELMIHLREKHTVADNPLNINKKNYDIVKRAIAYIRKNYGRKLTLDDIARNVYIGKYTLSREFRKLTGHTVVEYINIYRCKLASELILSGMSVFEAASMCGFGNMSFFTRMFTRYMKCLPSKFKEK